MSDLIERKPLYELAARLEAEALDEASKLTERERVGEVTSEDWRIWSAVLAERTAFKHDVFDAPSVEPEIIHCGDCKYKDDGIDEDGIPFLKCLHGRSYGGTRINDFCSWAKRRTDE